MAWQYTQKTGEMRHKGALLTHGYSGAEPNGKNNPYAQERKNVGPIPVGRYTIASPRDSVTHGPYVLPLTPDPTNKMFGRGSFLVHGDSKTHPGQASQGCIVISPKSLREQIWLSGDDTLEVVSGLDPLPSQVQPNAATLAASLDDVQPTDPTE